MSSHLVDPAPLDVVYTVRPGHANEELRHSLRSVATSLPHAKVWVAGFKPRWVADTVGHVPGGHDPIKNKYVNARRCLEAALQAEGPTETVILMHDDMYIVEPMPMVPILHRGTGREFERYLQRRHAPSSYSAGAAHTHAWLLRQGVAAESVLSYSLHVPLPVVRPQAVAALQQLPRSRFPWHLRTIYGTLCGIGGERVEQDCKVLRVNPKPVTEAPTYPYPLVSTSDRTFASGGIGRWLRSRYPHPCRYER